MRGRHVPPRRLRNGRLRRQRSRWQRSGRQRSGRQRSGRQRSRWQRSGWQRSGRQRSGWQRGGRQRCRWQRSRWQRSRWQRSRWQRSGWQRRLRTGLSPRLHLQQRSLQRREPLGRRPEHRDGAAHPRPASEQRSGPDDVWLQRHRRPRRHHRPWWGPRRHGLLPGLQLSADHHQPTPRPLDALDASVRQRAHSGSRFLLGARHSRERADHPHDRRHHGSSHGPGAGERSSRLVQHRGLHLRHAELRQHRRPHRPRRHLHAGTRGLFGVAADSHLPRLSRATARARVCPTERPASSRRTCRSPRARRCSTSTRCRRR